MIAHRKTVVAYLPVLYGSGDSFDAIRSTKSQPIKDNSKLEVLSALHSVIEVCLESLQSIGAKGVDVRTRKGNSEHMHFLVASFIADISGLENLRWVKRGNRTFSPCHTCFISCNEFSECTRASQQTMASLMKILQDPQSLYLNDQSEDLLEKFSMHPFAPVLHSFLFVGVHKSVGSYALFGLQQSMFYLLRSTKR